MLKFHLKIVDNHLKIVENKNGTQINLLIIMVTRHNLIYSIAAAQRILGIKTGLYKVEEWVHVVWVHGAGFCRFMSKKLFKKHFADRRKEEAKNVNFYTENNIDFTAYGNSGSYAVKALDKEVTCTCEDYKNQSRFLKRGVCKHGYAALNHLGFNSLQDYIERDRTYQRIPHDAPLYIPPRQRVRGRSVD